MPERTCVGCRRRLDQAELIRIHLVDGEPVIGRGDGRGAWVGLSPACLELSRKRLALSRALAVEANAVGFAKLSDSWPAQPLACPHEGR